jgi:hypothetical protein
VRLRISSAVTARVSRHVGHLPRHVLLLPAGSLPKTASASCAVVARANCCRHQHRCLTCAG